MGRPGDGKRNILWGWPYCILKVQLRIFGKELPSFQQHLKSLSGHEDQQRNRAKDVYIRL